jgi:hypothetical protein
VKRFLRPCTSSRIGSRFEAVRLRAHDEDRVFFREAIQIPDATAKVDPPHTPKTEAQKLMWENATKLRERIISMIEGERQGLVTFLLNRCVLVVVATESRAAALRIFRVLNDRGLDLSNADVIKADLLGKFKDPTEIAHQAARWREFEIDRSRPRGLRGRSRKSPLHPGEEQEQTLAERSL